jgi:hypothetical protein
MNNAYTYNFDKEKYTWWKPISEQKPDANAQYKTFSQVNTLSSSF